MSLDSPIAFLSYVRADDEHDRGRITAFRERLEGEVRMQTGKSFKIFQDKNDIKWGQNWKERLDGTLLSVTFLIPVITPSYFFSEACRDEFEKFQLRERQLGENRLILPIYYLESEAIQDSSLDGGDPIAKVVASRNWADWRDLRFKILTTPEVESAIAEMAKTIKQGMKEIEAVIAASNVTMTLPPPPPPEELISASQVAGFSPIIPTLRYGSSKNFSRSSGVKLDEYHAYTKLNDEEIHAEDLSSKEELLKLSKYLSKSVNLIKRNNKGIIFLFENDLRSLQGSSNFSITILIDNSGSMRGSKIMYSASWARIIAEALDRVSIPVEVLGFTTKAWKGGLSRERWLQDNKPSQPGRLNDIRHIIYKDFGAKFAGAKNNFGLMAREGILKENIDGEAILWAYERALNEGRAKKIMIVITDGTPVDDSTISVNDPNILSNHLLMSTKWIESQDDFKLFAISIDPKADPSRFYSNFFRADHLPDIGQSLLAIISNLIGGREAASSG